MESSKIQVKNNEINFKIDETYNISLKENGNELTYETNYYIPIYVKSGYNQKCILDSDGNTHLGDLYIDNIHINRIRALSKDLKEVISKASWTRSVSIGSTEYYHEDKWTWIQAGSGYRLFGDIWVPISGLSYNVTLSGENIKGLLVYVYDTSGGITEQRINSSELTFSINDRVSRMIIYGDTTEYGKTWKGSAEGENSGTITATFKLTATWNET